MGYTPVQVGLSVSTVDDTENLNVNLVYFWKRPWVKIYWFLCQYWTYGVIWGLYVCLQDTPDATRPFLVDIAPSRAILSAILVPRDPWDNSEMCVSREVSCQEALVSGGFLASDVSHDPCKWTNTVSEMGIEPSCVGIGQKLISVDQKTTTAMVMVFPTLWLKILRIFTKTDTWILCCRNFSQTVCHPNCQSNTPI